MHNGPRNPIQCIVPPHILQNIAENGSDQQRAWAIGTLTQSEQFRGQRIATPQFAAMGIRAATTPGMKRTVFDARFSTNLPGTIARNEGDPPTGDPAVDEAYDGAGETYNLYKDIYNRDSIDGLGLPIRSTVHFGQGYDNAFWNGQQMVYGDGDEDLPPEQRLFNRFTAAIDIIAHELTHGVTQYESQLVYRDQPGALNESLSDIFGILVKQRQLNHTAEESDWIIGDGLLTENVNGIGIRSLKAPGTAYNDPVLGKDPQPGHMKDYQNVSYDNGGVHINSGIPNHAFYVMCREIGGFSWEKMGQIWYVTQLDKLRLVSQFQDAANLTFAVAGSLFGTGSLEQQAVQVGWQEVGISVAGIDDGGDDESDDGTSDDQIEPQGCWQLMVNLMTKGTTR
jgi:Zn-dependent metalloprotease